MKKNKLLTFVFIIYMMMFLIPTIVLADDQIFNMTGIWNINIPSDGTAFIGTVVITDQTETDFIGTFQVNSESSTNIENGKIIGNNVTFARNIGYKNQNYSGTLDVSTGIATIIGNFDDTYSTFKMTKKLPIITGNSVWRSNATTAIINFISDTTGVAYYKITDSIVAPTAADIKTTGTYGGSITANITKSISLTGLTSGAKYVHVLVENEDSLSNVLTIEMPYHVYYFDDFESYSENAYPEFFYMRYNGGSTSSQKIITLNENKVFNAYGTYSTGLDERIQINPLSTGYAVVETDISMSSLTNSWYFGGIVIGPNWDNNNRNIVVQVHPDSNKFVSGENSGNHTSSILFEANKNYHVKMVLDVQNYKLDYYINNVKANENPINIASSYYTSLNWFGIYNGAGTVYYDNMKFYATNTAPEPTYTISKGTETNGTFTIDESSTGVGETITVISNPDAGYRVKTVKINGLETVVTKVSTNNYSFEMPNTNVTVDVEFEKIPYTITINTGIGFTTSPNETINVVYGDDQDITITADLGYRLKSVKVNGIEQLPLLNDKVILENITENKEVVVIVEKLSFTITANEVTGATINPNGIINVEYGDNKEIKITEITGYRLKSVKVDDDEKIPLIENKLTLTNIIANTTVLVKVEKIPYTITINTGIGFTTTPNGIINVVYGDDQDITITADLGYRLESVKVNGVEQLPLLNNKVILENITENKEVVVIVEKIKYDVINGDGQRHIIGKNEDAVFRINADKDLFLKVYLNNEELNSEFYKITEGSTIITLKQDFLNNLLPGTYNLKATFTDGGEAVTTFVITNAIENPNTGDGIINSIILGSMSLIVLLGASIYLNKKRFN